MSNEEINAINSAALAKYNADQAAADDLAHRKELFRENFSIEALTYLKYGTISRLNDFQAEQEYFSRLAAEAARKSDRAMDNIATAKNEIRAIDEILAEKRKAAKQN
jgi:hypothetical protein